MNTSTQLKFGVFMKERLALYAPFILVGIYPLGMALQNIGSALTLLFLLPVAIENRKKISQMNFATKAFYFSFMSWMLVAVISTLLNSKNVDARFSKFFGAYLGFLLLPLCFYLQKTRLIISNKEKLLNTFIYGTTFIAAICFSQKIFGWQVSGSSIEFAEGLKRSRGLYSHPLSLAYVALLFWPLTVGIVFNNVKSFKSWLLLASMVSILVLSSSRTVQAVCVMTLGLQIFFTLKGKQRILSLLVACFLVSGVALTNNPISSRFKSTLTHKSALRDKGYPDDRVAFWHVFSEMIKERPVLGHGIDLNTKYRTPYYEALGLGEFKKKYSAHNMFIQVTAESGFVGLVFFCLFLLSIINLFFAAFDNTSFKMVSALTMFGFIIAALTQNAFQDSIVKNALILWIVVAFDLIRQRDDAVTD